MASVPEPSPLNKGYEVTPHLLNWLSDKNFSDNVRSLINSRMEYGMKKYGQGLMTEDGRDSMEDALQEVGDLLQYLFKAYLTRDTNSEKLVLIKEIITACCEILECLKE